MKWQEVRELAPHRWVVIEAINAYTEGARRVVDELTLVGAFGDDFRQAWECYKANADGRRELYPVHTVKEELQIEIMDKFHRVIKG